MGRFWKFADVSENEWTNWHWQQRNRFTSDSKILEFFPHLPSRSVAAFSSYAEKFHLALTPYVLSLIELDKDGNPKSTDPIWNQFRFWSQGENSGATDYNRSVENWENAAEMPTPILHHKYKDRAIFRLTNTCFGHCNYCYIASRTLDRDTKIFKVSKSDSWERSLEYLQANPQIQDVLLSGGDPLVFSDEKIDRLFSDLGRIKSIKTKRLNTRVTTFNPYRITKELVQVFKKHQLTALELHISHPKEINDVFDEKMALFDEVGFRPLMLWRSPLLYGVNDSVEVLHELFLKLYARRITPYYLFHYAPFAPGRSSYGISVRAGAEILSRLRRSLPGPAFPQYALFHVEGKQDIPLDPNGTDHFRYETDDIGNPVVRFLNWKGRWVTYYDVVDFKHVPESTPKDSQAMEAIC